MIKNLEGLYDELAYVAGELHRRHWAESNAGNISVNITSLLKHGELPAFFGGEPWKTRMPYKNLNGQHLLVSLSGSRMCDLAKDPPSAFCHLKFDHEGNAVLVRTLDSQQPTSELLTHLAMQDYFAGHEPENKVLLHTHPDEIIALTHLDEFKDTMSMNSLLWNIHPEMQQFIPDGAGLIPFTEAGNEGIAAKTLEEFITHRLVIWAKHGCMACGPLPRDAYDLVDVMAKAARIYLWCRGTGR